MLQSTYVSNTDCVLYSRTGIHLEMSMHQLLVYFYNGNLIAHTSIEEEEMKTLTPSGILVC